MVEKLAIDGGTRTVSEGIIKPWPWITDEERQAVLDVISDRGGGLQALYGPRQISKTVELPWPFTRKQALRYIAIDIGTFGVSVSRSLIDWYSILR